VTHAAASRKPQKAPTTSGPDEGSAASNEDEMAGLVSDWLEEADEVDRQTRIDPETREYKVGGADTEPLKVEIPKNNGATEDNDKKEKSSGKSGDTGKLPLKASKKDAPKDTQEAAAQMLRKFFNRG
jgi:hypothetical protein